MTSNCARSLRTWLRLVAPGLASLAVLCSVAAPAAAIIIDNLSAPPDPNNVIDHALYTTQTVTVIGGPPPGAATVVALVPGGVVDRIDTVLQGIILLDGGVARLALASTDGSISVLSGSYSEVRSIFAGTTTLSGGHVDLLNAVLDSSWRITGGSIGLARLEEFSTGTLVGQNFFLDGVPIAAGLGQIMTTSGRLTGVLESGELIDTNLELFASRLEVVIVPEPSTALLVGIGLVGIAVRRQR